MVNIEELRKIEGNELLFGVLLISGAVCPGMLVIWNFSPVLIEKCGSIMFLLLSIAITLPILSINTLVILLVVKLLVPEKELDWAYAAKICVAIASGVTMLEIGIPVFLAFMYSFSLKTFSYCVCTAEVLLLVIVTIVISLMEKNNRKT